MIFFPTPIINRAGIHMLSVKKDPMMVAEVGELSQNIPMVRSSCTKPPFKKLIKTEIAAVVEKMIDMAKRRKKRLFV